MTAILERVYTPGALDSWGMHRGYRQHFSVEEDPHKDPPERMLWWAFMQQKVDDAIGIGRANGKGKASKMWCYECHFDDLTCGCFTVLADKVTLHKTDPDIAYVYNGARRQRLSLRSTRLFPDGHKYYRVLRPRCPNTHTVQQCAKNWLMSKDAEELCFLWDIDVRACRRQAGLSEAQGAKRL